MIETNLGLATNKVVEVLLHDGWHTVIQSIDPEGSGLDVGEYEMTSPEGGILFSSGQFGLSSLIIEFYEDDIKTVVPLTHVYGWRFSE